MSNSIKLIPITTETQLHLYLAWGCPFCHRVLAALAVSGLQEKLSITWTKNIKADAGWEFNRLEEPLFNAKSLQSLYQQLEPEKKQRYSVPLLVDKKSLTILSNESSEIVRFISFGFNNRYRTDKELVPVEHLQMIDKKNQWLHERVNRAVYLIGFATEQSDYEKKLAGLFDALDEIESYLSEHSYLVGGQLTESDLFLLATLERFDTIYFWLFRCNLRRIADYPFLSEYHKRIKNIGSLDSTYQEQLTVEHYFLSTMHVRGEIRDLNPSKKIPARYIEDLQSRKQTY
jgi:putative glutathione S-transferase